MAEYWATTIATIITTGISWERWKPWTSLPTQPWLSGLSRKFTISGGSKMSKSKVSIATGTAERFFNRVRSHAAKLDRGEIILPNISITFEDPLELLNVLTAERVRLLRWAKAGSQPIAELATGLKR